MNYEDEREILVGENRFYLGKNKIIYVTLNEKEIDEESVLKMRGAFVKYLFMANEKCDVLAINKTNRKPSFKLKQIFKDISKNEKFGKVAMLNMGPEQGGFLSFASKLTKNEKLNFFNKRGDALTWFKNESSKSKRSEKHERY